MNKIAVNDSGKNRIGIKLIYLLSLLAMPMASMAQPKVAEVTEISNCQYLTEVEGSSGYGKKFDWKGFAQASVLNQAEKLGASHLVWERYYPVGAFNGIVVAKTYRCES